MSKPGAEHAEDIRDSLVCLKCSYSLRGLPGDVVTCPECGERINIAVMITQQWRSPWYRAPLYNVLVMPVVWAVFTLFIAAMSFTASVWQPAPFTITFAILLGGVAVWIPIIYIAAKKFGGLEGAFLTMLLHLLCGGYLVGFLGVIGSIMGLIGAVLSGGGANVLLQGGIILVVCIGIIVAARVGERFVAGRCIRRHLRRLSKV